MKMKRLLVGVVGILVIHLAGSAQADEARKIMEMQKARHEAQTEESRANMTLIDRRGREKTRGLYTIKMKDGERNRVLLKFLAPGDIRNVGLLTWEQPGGKEDDQWLFLPASKRVKRISGGAKKNSFMGTDLAFEDLRPENLDSFQYEVLPEQIIDGQSCHVITAVPNTAKEKQGTGYSKRVLYIRKDILVTVKTEYFDRRDKMSKVSRSSKFENLKGDLWRGNHFEMENLMKKTKTILEHHSRKLDPELGKDEFSQAALRRPSTIR